MGNENRQNIKINHKHNDSTTSEVFYTQGANEIPRVSWNRQQTALILMEIHIVYLTPPKIPIPFHSLFSHMFACFSSFPSCYFDFVVERLRVHCKSILTKKEEFFPNASFTILLNLKIWSSHASFLLDISNHSILTVLPDDDAGPWLTLSHRDTWVTKTSTKIWYFGNDMHLCNKEVVD